MRSSKSRSRSKSNRPRTMGNIVNRVFDSSGPEGKVRGTPQQIIEKYLFLARDAQLSNDRVAAENFMQHAEHYTRMLGEAQREMAAEQESRQTQQNSNYNNNGNGYSQNRDQRGDDPGNDEQPYISAEVNFGAYADAGLVETPEARAPRQDREQRHDRGPQERAPRQDNEPRQERAPRQDNRNDRNRDDRAPRAPRDEQAQPEPMPMPAAVEQGIVEPVPVQQPSLMLDPAPPRAEGPPKSTLKPRAPRKPRVEGDEAAKPAKPRSSKPVAPSTETAE